MATKKPVGTKTSTRERDLRDAVHLVLQGGMPAAGAAAEFGLSLAAVRSAIRAAEATARSGEAAASTEPPAAGGPLIVFTFAHGITEAMPAVDDELQRVRQRQAMMANDDPELQSAGRRSILNSVIAQAQGATRQKEKQAARDRAHTASRAQRPGRTSELKGKMLALMAIHKGEGESFKVFLRTWEARPLEGLRLAKAQAGKYEVTDENSTGGQSRCYSEGTLMKEFSKA